MKVFYIILLSLESLSYAFIPYISNIKNKKSISNSLVKLKAHNISIPRNTSKIYKMDFNEESEIDLFFKPKYLFGLSDFHLTFIRIYIYIYTYITIFLYISNKK